MHASGASRRENAKLCREYARATFPAVIARLDRATQYSRDTCGGIEKPRRTGYPACAGCDNCLRGTAIRKTSPRHLDQAAAMRYYFIQPVKKPADQGE
jgi:hypothetical protein